MLSVGDFLILSVGFLFTFFVPGFLLVETFFYKLAPLVKFPLYLILSVLLSTHVIYFFSLLVGFSTYSVLFVFLIFSFWLLFYIWKLSLLERIKSFPKKHLPGLCLSIFVFLIFLIALYPAIFYKHGGYFVMAADNWQDTPMHLGIIESISQGNFPPQAPYFAGEPLRYYYFSDLHTAILQVLVADFLPRLLVLDNAFFVLIFALSVYSLAYYLTRRRLVAIFSVLFGVLNGNLMFFNFFYDAATADIFSGNFWAKFFGMIASGNYSMDYLGFMQVTPMVDYFLQNRPMMVGLSAVVLAALLSFIGANEKNNKPLLLAGILTGMLMKFQLFAFGSAIAVFFLAKLIFIASQGPKDHSKQFMIFFAPVVFFGLLGTNGSSFIVSVFKDSFSLGPWDHTKNVLWYIQFYLVNFGTPFVITFFSLIVLIKMRKLNKVFIFLFLWFALMFVTLHIARFTIFERDMFKFFYFMTVPMAIITSWFLWQVAKRRYGRALVVAVFALSSFTSVLTLGASLTNRNFAYSESDYNAGLWIRDNTPARSTFINLPTVHSPIDQIGGRLRVLSYINWPHSHGFNKGEDSVFTRQVNIEGFYTDPSHDKILDLEQKYKANYVYYGREERNKFPNARAIFDASDSLVKIYDESDQSIYEIRTKI